MDTIKLVPLEISLKANFLGFQQSKCQYERVKLRTRRDSKSQNRMSISRTTIIQQDYQLVPCSRKGKRNRTSRPRGRAYRKETRGFESSSVSATWSQAWTRMRRRTRRAPWGRPWTRSACEPATFCRPWRPRTRRRRQSSASSPIGPGSRRRKT